MLSEIGNLLKQNYRIYSRDLLEILEAHGYSDLRPSFLEILLFMIDGEGASIKEVGIACGLKKQTMTSHLNALEKRGYLKRSTLLSDKRQQSVQFTSTGNKLKFILISSIKELEVRYIKTIGQLELERVKLILKEINFKLKSAQNNQSNNSLMNTQSLLPF